MIYYFFPDLTVDYYLFHCQSIPTVDVTVWRYHSNFLSSMVVAQGSNFVRLFARFCQQRLHVPKKMTGKLNSGFDFVLFDSLKILYTCIRVTGSVCTK